jgi:hypothetical protein
MPPVRKTDGQTISSILRYGGPNERKNRVQLSQTAQYLPWPEKMSRVTGLQRYHAQIAIGSIAVGKSGLPEQVRFHSICDNISPILGVHAQGA